MPAEGAAPERVRWAVALLDPRPAEHLLEIGCGAGHAVALVAARLGRGTITRVDRSAAAVERARARNAAAIAAGRARIELARFEDAAPDRRFARALAINVNAFWTTPAAAFPVAARLLAPRGTLWLVYEPPSAARLRELRTALPTFAAEHAFTLDAAHERALGASRGLCLVLRRGAADVRRGPRRPAPSAARGTRKNAERSVRRG